MRYTQGCPERPKRGRDRRCCSTGRPLGVPIDGGRNPVKASVGIGAATTLALAALIPLNQVSVQHAARTAHHQAAAAPVHAQLTAYSGITAGSVRSHRAHLAASRPPGASRSLPAVSSGRPGQLSSVRDPAGIRRQQPGDELHRPLRPLPVRLRYLGGLRRQPVRLRSRLSSSAESGVCQRHGYPRWC